MTDHFQFALRMGDTTLVLAQRLSEWVGKGPALEEDMALTNTALDLLGQARLWLTLAGELEGRGRQEDVLAYMRNADEFCNFLLVEQPNGSYADTLVRQYLFDVWHWLQLDALGRSNLPAFQEIAAKALKEVTYHLRRSANLVVRLGDGSTESHRRMQASLDELWMYTGEMFEADTVDQRLAHQGAIAHPGVLRAEWLKSIEETLTDATLTMPSPDAWMQTGGRTGRHTEHMGFLLAEMQVLQRSHPGLQW